MLAFAPLWCNPVNHLLRNDHSRLKERAENSYETLVVGIDTHDPSVLEVSRLAVVMSSMESERCYSQHWESRYGRRYLG